MRRVRAREFHAAAVKIWQALSRKQRKETSATSIRRALRKRARLEKLTTNGRALPARPWPAKPHNFDLCPAGRNARRAA